jgi:hypothetical protein
MDYAMVWDQSCVGPFATREKKNLYSDSNVFTGNDSPSFGGHVGEKRQKNRFYPWASQSFAGFGICRLASVGRRQNSFYRAVGFGYFLLDIFNNLRSWSILVCR